MSKDMKMKRPLPKKGTLGRVIKSLFKFYPVLVPIAMLCILFTAVVSALPAIFMRRIFEAIELWQASGDFAAARPAILSDVLLLGGMYAVSIVSVTLYNQLMVYITQGFLDKLRVRMFSGMQDLPIRYFDQSSRTRKDRRRNFRLYSHQGALCLPVLSLRCKQSI